MKPRTHLIGALLITLTFGALTSCQKTQNASAEQVATQFGENQQDPTAADGSAIGAADQPATQDSTPEQSGRNRFGFAGGDADSPVKPLRRDTQSYSPAVDRSRSTNLKPAGDINKIKPPKPPVAPSPPSSSLVKLGFATNVPGDNLHVTLPGEYASLGPISVEKMDPAGNSLGSPWARGTQMQIPNPKVPGGKIYFKVP